MQRPTALVGYIWPYFWRAFMDEDGGYVLAIGCETWPLEWWPALAWDLAQERPMLRGEYTELDVDRTIAGLVTLVSTVFDRELGRA